MSLMVWVDSWQQECCGERFGIGSTVEWTLAACDDELLTLFPPQAKVRIDWAEEHHGGLADDAPSTRGIVRSIQAIQFAYTRVETTGGASGPIPGSAILSIVSESDGAELRWKGFAGYVVEVVTDNE